LLSPDTIDQLQAHLAFDEKIGAVGALLNYPESEGGSIQHDGVLTGFEWVARNITHVDDCSAIRIPRNVAAVTGACLLTRRAAWEAVGGFETDLAVSFNDVDYCLKLREHGWRIVQASDVVAIHRESRTRGELDSQSKRDQITAEVQWMQERWGDALTDRCSARETDRYRGSLIMHVGE
jgi:GT2 family glycosyltransferase